MNNIEKMRVGALAITLPCVIVIGGLFAPNTIAGAIAKFVFSCN